MPADDPCSPAQTEAELRRLANVYARAMDRDEPELLDTIVTDDIVIEGPGFRQQGLAEIRGNPAILRQMFLMTRHVVHNQTVRIHGDEAEGETYCTASHILRPGVDGEGDAALVWAVRYQDRFRRVDDRWRFSRRTLIIDWTETRPVTLAAGPNPQAAQAGKR
jgi:hypothetical protein